MVAQLRKYVFRIFELYCYELSVLLLKFQTIFTCWIETHEIRFSTKTTNDTRMNTDECSQDWHCLTVPLVRHQSKTSRAQHF